LKTAFSCIIIQVLILVLTTQSVFASDFAELENKANQGDAEAMYELGEMYENGVGTIQNYIEAHKWYNIAASRGYVKAYNARDAISEKMIAGQLAEAQKLAAQWKPSRSQVAEGKDEKEGKAQITGFLTINLRSSYKDLGYDQVKASLKKYNFFDQHRNENGDFINEYELKMIEGDDVVEDHITGLMWHQSGSEKSMKWGDAKEWIEDLNGIGYAGYHDWRLPTVEEAASLLESSENDDYLYIDLVFNSKQRLIWTGDSFGSRGAWDVNFSTGGVIWRFTNLNLYVRPVRSGK